ncbi:YggT family protein [Prochlorococcus sp. MIT 1300]|uniref:YggT family protein n=1 Tax=Prochlorococcus sp. MIT 1300 TaxID=3096218 RepID=UPI002A760D5A|nr:YggT family protein [Prochlorococcus sp. MIT 1300]
MSTEILAKVLQIFYSTISIYLLLLFVRVLLSWFPNLDWSNPLLSNLSSITDPYLNAFRGLIPPLGGLDLSPLLAFLALQLMQSLLSRATMTALNSSMVYYN